MATGKYQLLPILLLAALPACTPTAWEPALGDVRTVVPSASPPPETPADRSNNNVSIALHDDRLLLAWRTIYLAELTFAPAD